MIREEINLDWVKQLNIAIRYIEDHLTGTIEYETWKYYIAVATSETAKFEFEKLIIPASKWAIFSGKGTNVSLQDLERRVITEWLPFSGFEYGNAPDIERYIQADPENAEYEYWLSIRNEKK